MSSFSIINSSGSWKGKEISGQPDWQIDLTENHIKEINELISGNGQKNSSITQLFADARETLENGPGVVLIRNCPVHDLNEGEAKKLFSILASLIGTLVSQSSEGELIFSVRDSGYKEDDPRSRGPNTRKKLSFHSDRCDVIGFLCLKQAMSGGENQIVSSIAIHNHLVENEPGLIKYLYEPFYYRRHNVDTGNELPYCRQPIFSVTEGKFACNLLRVLIDRAYAMPELPDMSEEQKRALDAIEETASLTEMHFNFRQRPGDILFLNNWTTLHRRSEFIDFPDPEKKRHILRAWISPPNNRPIDPLFEDNYGDHRAGKVRGGMRPE
ncbi:MAG: TauD/TfdA family dioxygenase [Verrucomicrobiota bacterium]|nr:TauD/TfdA family dioxygenase [Verrucomicrobiota bacterium]